MLARCSRRSCDQSEVQVAFAGATVPLGGAFCRVIEGAAIPPTATFALRRLRPSTGWDQSVKSIRRWPSADFVLSVRQQLVRIDAERASDGDVFRRVMAGIEQGPHASLDAPWLRSIRTQAPARTLSGGQQMRRPENENNVGQANGGDRQHDRHPV
jgi:hypothetical protein